MASLTIKVSAKAEAMIATLQKEIFNRRRKKVSAQGVVETLVESGAKSQSDKRYAASWKNLIKDVEKAAKVSEIHGNKPSNISAEEWALILAHRTRKETKETPKTRASSTKVVTKKAVTKKPAAKKAVTKKAVAKKAPVARAPLSKRIAAATKAAPAKGRPARRARRSLSAATPK